MLLTGLTSDEIETSPWNYDEHPADVIMRMSSTFFMYCRREVFIIDYFWRSIQGHVAKCTKHVFNPELLVLCDVLNIDWLWQDEAIHVIGGIQQNCVRLSSFAGFGANAHWFANRTAFLLNFLRSVSTICPSTFNFSNLCSTGRPGGETTARGGLCWAHSEVPAHVGISFVPAGPIGQMVERGLTTPCHLQICWIFLRSLESTKCVLMFSLSRLDCFASALVS